MNRGWKLDRGRSRALRFLSVCATTWLILIGLYGLPADQSPATLSQRPIHQVSQDQTLASFLQTQPAMAQRMRASDIADIVYAQHPDLPLENGYINAESGDVDEDNTLISRFIRYHVYVVRRLPNFRLDWKLTFADYLGANTWIVEEEYPDATDLRGNPRSQDIDAIGQLSIAKRDAVVETLVEIFSEESARLPGFGL